MKVDTRDDNYDELMILAADARASRRRTNIWTTGLIVGGMIAASAYVSTTNDQVDQLADEARDLRAMVEQLKWDRDKRVVQLEQIRRERDFYKENTESLAQAVPNFKLSDAISNLSLTAPPAEQSVPRTTAADVTRRRTDVNLANIVWIVDGSRRFPLAPGDILWIPEGGFWLEYSSRIVGGVKQHDLLRYDGERPGTEDNGIPLEPLPLATSESYEPYRTSVQTQGVSSCLEITLHPRSNRPGFTSGVYVDIEVLYREGAQCPNR